MFIDSEARLIAIQTVGLQLGESRFYIIHFKEAAFPTGVAAIFGETDADIIAAQDGAFVRCFLLDHLETNDLLVEGYWLVPHSPPEGSSRLPHRARRVCRLLPFRPPRSERVSCVRWDVFQVLRLEPVPGDPLIVSLLSRWPMKAQIIPIGIFQRQSLESIGGSRR